MCASNKVKAGTSSCQAGRSQRLDEDEAFLERVEHSKPHFVKTIFLLLNSRKQLKKRMASCLNHDIVLPEVIRHRAAADGNYFKTCQS
jgi:hypothetical protein